MISETEITPDAIIKTILLRAPLSRVWAAITDADRFGQWFGVRFDGPFVPNTSLTGRITPTIVDAAVAEAQKPYEGTPFVFELADIIPQSLFSFHWHPYAVDPSVDYSAETPTLVSFVLEEVEDGVRLTVTESGFSQIPLARRAEAFRMNEGGWTAQMRLIEAYLARFF